MHATAMDLRKGLLVTHQGRTCTVIHWNILRNDRRTFVQMKLRDLETGRVTELKEHGDSKYEVLDSETVDLAHSYRDGDVEVFYTPDGVEYRCPRAAVEEQLKWQVDAYKGLLVDGHLVTVSLPQTVVATVAETSPPIKGGGGSGSKDAVLDNGVKVRVGLIVASGDRVRLDAETLEYKERVQG
jgi:translation elongation factor P/translation initiation factor 5A